ncbi:MAG: MFS transporter [Anaerovoracaceae bacterium]
MRFFTIWLMVITTLQWMTLDLYLPALPVLKVELGISESLLNVSLNTGIIACAVGTLVSGTLSDRYGRKSMLFFGLITAAAAYFLCSFSNGIVLLSLMRGIGGLGTGFVLTITTAMIKDSFSGRRFKRNMTVLQSIAVLGPIVAPSLGSVIINFSSWRFLFVFFGAVTAISLLPMIPSTETWPLEKRTVASFRQMLAEAGEIITSRSFSLFLAIMALLTIPVWAYVSVSSYVYINDFGLSNLLYGAFYAVGSLLSFLAPFIYMTLTKFMKTGRVVTIAICCLAAGGSLLILCGRFDPLLFLAGVLPIMIAEGIIRPLGMAVLLEDNSGAVGTASALMQFVLNLVGIVGTSLATLRWPSMILGVAVVALGCAAGAVVCWIAVRKQGLMKKSLNR